LFVSIVLYLHSRTESFHENGAMLQNSYYVIIIHTNNFYYITQVCGYMFQ